MERIKAIKLKNETHRLGDYIREVNVRNRKLRVNLSQGICNDKYFQNPKQVADNPETHKIVRTGQFAYNRATTRNGDKLSIALRQGPDCTVSAAYQVFEVSRPDLLLPEYLMMWFKRPEFDRLALFYSHGSAHEFFEWESMCDVQLPVPSIERQREIVSEYETLTHRIRLNEQMIEKLEATAQALYRHTFVDNIDKQNLPQGWHLGKLGNYVDLSQGIQVEVEDQSPIKLEGYNRFIRIIDYTPNTKEPPRYVNIANDRYYCTRDDVVVIRYGDAGTICRRLEGIIANNLFKATPKTDSPITRNYLYHFLKSESVQKKIKGSAASSTMPAITHTTIKELVCIIPNDSISQAFDEHVCMIEKEIRLKLDENIKLTELQSLLLAKMGQ
ncbi:MAG: restriction endonuclease subunit S [Bacteroidales bacterium]|nr:restriction endonuclease subunit S [Bacteroidales bacterium]